MTWSHPILRSPNPHDQKTREAATRRFAIATKSEEIMQTLYKGSANGAGGGSGKDVLLLQAPTGCGKSTLVPLYVLEALYRLRRQEQSSQHEKGRGRGNQDENVDECDCDCVWVTQPTRVACKRLASFVANKLLASTNNNHPQEKKHKWKTTSIVRFGQEVGYAISQEARFCADKSRLVFATPSYALQHFLNQEKQRRDNHATTTSKKGRGRSRRETVCSALVIDEAHCRDIDMELLISWAKRNLLFRGTANESEDSAHLIPLRKLVIMSATIDTNILQKALLASNNKNINVKEEEEKAKVPITAERIATLQLFSREEETQEAIAASATPTTATTTSQRSNCHPFPVQAFFATNISSFDQIPGQLQRKLSGFSAANERLFVDFSITRYAAIAHLILYRLQPRGNVVVYVAGLAEMLSLYYALTSKLLRRVDVGHASMRASSSALDGVQEFVVAPPDAEKKDDKDGTEVGDEEGSVGLSVTKPVVGHNLEPLRPGHFHFDNDDGGAVTNNNSNNTKNKATNNTKAKRCTSVPLPHERLAGSPIDLVMLHSTELGEVSEHLRKATSDLKIILSTNVTENSVTLPNVGTVIDLGIERVECVDHSTGGLTLTTRFISKGSMLQRRGRVGRTQPGVALHLYAPSSLVGEFQWSELRSVGAERLVLRLKQHIRSPDLQRQLLAFYPFHSAFATFAAFHESVETAVRKLHEQDALTTHHFDTSQLTSFGRIVASLPLPVAMCRFIVLGLHLGCITDCVVLAAAMSLPDLFTRRMLAPDVLDPDAVSKVILQPLQRRVRSFGDELSEMWGLRNVLVDWYDSSDRRYVHKAASHFANFARLRCIDVLVQSLVWRVMHLLKQQGQQNQSQTIRKEEEGDDDGMWRHELSLLRALRWRVQDHTFEQMDRSLSLQIAKNKRAYVMNHRFSQQLDVFAQGDAGKRRVMEAFVGAFARQTVIGAPVINPVTPSLTTSSSFTRAMTAGAAASFFGSGGGGGAAQRILSINSLDTTCSCMMRISLSNPRLLGGVSEATLRATLVNLLGLFGVRFATSSPQTSGDVDGDDDDGASVLEKRFAETMCVSRIGLVQNGRQCVLEFGTRPPPPPPQLQQQKQNQKVENETASVFKPLTASPEVLLDGTQQQQQDEEVVAATRKRRSSNEDLAIAPTGALVANFLVRRIGSTLGMTVHLKLPPPTESRGDTKKLVNTAETQETKEALSRSSLSSPPKSSRQEKKFIAFNRRTKQIEITLQRKHQAAVSFQQKSRDEKHKDNSKNITSTGVDASLKLDLRTLQELGLDCLCPKQWLNAAQEEGDEPERMEKAVAAADDGKPPEAQQPAKEVKEEKQEEEEERRLQSEGEVCQISFNTPVFVNVVAWNYGLHTSNKKTPTRSQQQQQQQQQPTTAAYCPLCHRWCDSTQSLHEHFEGYSHTLRLLQAVLEGRSIRDVLRGVPPALAPFCPALMEKNKEESDTTEASPPSDSSASRYSYMTFARARTAAYSSPLDTLLAAPHRTLPILGVAATVYSIDRRGVDEAVEDNNNNVSSSSSADSAPTSPLRLRNLSILDVLAPSTPIGYLLTYALRRRECQRRSEITPDAWTSLSLLVSKAEGTAGASPRCVYTRAIALMYRPLNIVIPFHPNCIGCAKTENNSNNNNPLVDSIVRLVLHVSQHLSSSSSSSLGSDNVLCHNKHLKNAVSDCEAHLLPLAAAAHDDKQQTAQEPLAHHRLSMQDTFEWVSLDKLVADAQEKKHEVSQQSEKEVAESEFVDAMIILTLRDSIEAHKFRDSLVDFEGRLLLRLGAVHSTQSFAQLFQMQSSSSSSPSTLVSCPASVASSNARQRLAEYCCSRGFRSLHHILTTMGCWFEADSVTGCGLGGTWEGTKVAEEGAATARPRRKKRQGDAGVVYFNVPCVVSSKVPPPV